MARIIKIRVVPRGYVKVEEEYLDKETKRVMDKYTVSDMFMGLYNHFGNPQDGGVWSYMIRHNNVVLKITAETKETVKYDVWLSPGHILDAKRKRTKAMNVIARRLNEKDIAFIPEGDLADSLYYPIRQKNDALMRKNGFSAEQMDSELTDEERNVLYGGLSQFIPEVVTEIENMAKEVMG